MASIRAPTKIAAHFLFGRAFFFGKTTAFAVQKNFVRVLVFGASRLHQDAKRANQCTPIRFSVASRSSLRHTMERTTTDFRFRFCVKNDRARQVRTKKL
jgi:hypothetical protein